MEKSLRNVQVAKQKECGIWLDDGKIMSDLKITKVLNITWDTATSAVVEKAGEIVMVFIQHSSRQYNGLRREMKNNMLKGRDNYPTTVTSSYNLMLEWKPEPGSIQGGSVQCDNHLAFAEHNDQVNGKPTQPLHRVVPLQGGQTRKIKG